MPCTDGGVPYEDEIAFESTLCAIMAVLESNGISSEVLDGVDWKEAGVSRADFKTWWKAHQAADAARRKREKAEQEKSVLRAQAAKKLTKAERDALGL